jgi:CxxC-x17-CxxC domain-containing protein
VCDSIIVTGRSEWQALRFILQDGANAGFSGSGLKVYGLRYGLVFTAGEQQFYHEKDFKNEPKRCKACKVKRQNSPSERGVSSGRVETSAICSQCGRETTVPFRPTQGRPVFCRECFQTRRATGASAG